MNKKQLSFVVVIVIIVVGILVYGKLDHSHVHTGERHLIAQAFNQTSSLQAAIMECYRENKRLDGCDNGAYGIPGPYHDDNTLIAVVDGGIYMTFTNQINNALHGGAIQLNPDTASLGTDHPIWLCTFSNVHGQAIDMSLLPQVAHCTFDKN